jgi:archaetidylinositol phosphate synthase
MPRRVHRSLLAAAEKTLLVRLASGMPRWVTPDQLTALGVLGAALTFAGYLLSGRDPAFLWIANLGLLVHWFGDSLDGTLARVRGAERPEYGFLLDQSVDVASDILILAGLGLSPYARLDTALLALAGYHALAIHSLAWSSVAGEHRISGAIFGPTELRIVLFAMNVALWSGGAPKGFLGNPALSWCDALMLLAFAVMMLVFLAGVFTDAHALRAGRNPGDERGGDGPA